MAAPGTDGAFAPYFFQSFRMELKITKATAKGKKYRAEFLRAGDHRPMATVNFGAENYQDYTQHHDTKRREAYRARHKNDRIDDPMTPGALSWYILWGDSTSMEKNAKAFAKKFKLKLLPL